MASAAVLLSRLRRSRPSSLLYLSRVLTSHLPPPLPSPTTPHSPPTPSFLDAFRTRAFSTRSFHDHELETDSFGLETPVHSEILKAVVDSAGAGGEDNPAFPVRAVISMLDSFHDLTGFPWWITIVASTLAFRTVMLFPLILTLHKVKKIAEFVPKLPPPFPPPFSGKSYIRQFLFFEEKRKAVGCPSYVWPLVPYIVQVPCFFLWMISIRRMSVDGHPGFNCGGTLWFQNLTEHSHGYSGFIFPFLAAGLHYIIVQVSFKKPLVAETQDIFDLLSTYYKRYLDSLTLPIAVINFCIPQGSQLYWITNSSLTLTQHFALRNPTILAKLGLLDKNHQKAASDEIGASKTSSLLGVQGNSTTAAIKETVSPEKNPLDSPEKWHKIPVENMSSVELTTLAVPFLSSNDKESAIPLLKLALDKDPEYLRALVLMGRVLLLKQINDEAIKYFERAITKLLLTGHPTDPEEVDFLILSSQWAGIACERQGKRDEGRAHFERIANMEEPEDPTSKGYYFDGLLLLASTLYDAGQKAEAAKYLRPVVAFNPAYKKFLEQCEQDEDFASDLARSRREL
ncbi:ALBINO3-like protein 2, chloroplastic [Cicer arietinum]|uniref:ALBINO3-like protein 2, chloroplastic n=1 Tax=Cicer arietinum TaxID=3827 RepID=A0A1S3E157_CICAR|nr:ALBINO3-like protein 2, chloroplastic [Cicer arietinum]